jgi:drug/metabolite transporter (DMT)-like permease
LRSVRKTLVIVTLALLSALAFGGGVAFEARAAAEVPDEHAGRPSLLARLVRRPLWLAGLSANILGFALQAAALHRGSLVVVQPLLTTSLLFTLLIIAVWTRNPLTRSQWSAILLIVMCLAIFLGVSSPRHSPGGAADGDGWLLCTIAVVTVLAVSMAAGLRSRATARAALFGIAAGTSDAFMATLAKAFSRSLDHGFWAVFRTWTPYAVAGAGIAALLFISTAYQVGRPTVTLPVITVLDPIVAALIGITLYGERLRIGGMRGPAIALAVAGMITGLIMLSRDDAVASEVMPEPVRDSQPGRV